MASSALSFDQSSSKRARRKRAPNVVECSTIDLTLDDDDLPSVSLTNLETEIGIESKNQLDHDSRFESVTQNSDS